jgi:hypothetical protein
MGATSIDISLRVVISKFHTCRVFALIVCVSDAVVLDATADAAIRFPAARFGVLGLGFWFCKKSPAIM